MELCEGGELFDRIIAKGYYSERDAAPVLRAIVNAVKVCHSMGVMHRDLKPENFSFVSRDESALFFEEGKVYKDIVGSGFYIAPEVLRHRYGKEIDIWSAGVILYILLPGVCPFWAGENIRLICSLRMATCMMSFHFNNDTKKGTCEAISQGEIDFETGRWPSISSIAKDLLHRMLTQNPKRQITTA